MTENDEHDPISQTIATRVATYANSQDKNFSIDPFTIMAILNCIIAVIKLLYMCYSRKGVSNVFKNPNSLIHKIVLKKEIRKFFPKQGRKAVYDAMLSVSAGLSELEMNHLLNKQEKE